MIELGVLPRFAAHVLSGQTASALSRLRACTEEVWGGILRESADEPHCAECAALRAEALARADDQLGKARLPIRCTLPPNYALASSPPAPRFPGLAAQ